MKTNKPKVQNRSTKHDRTTQEIPLACADERAAVAFMEAKRWGDTPCCAHCGARNVYKMVDSKTGERQANFRWRCRECKKQYTVRLKTVFEDSAIPLRHWCYGFWRAATSKKGVSALEIHRQTGISYKSALFMLARIRFAMSDSAEGTLEGEVEVDEIYVGGKPRYRTPQGSGKRRNEKQIVMAMVEREGRVKTRPVATVSGSTLKAAIKDCVGKASTIYTDEHVSYVGIGARYEGGHKSVCHSKLEYVRDDVHTNTVESFFATMRRGITGIYHRVSKEHLHRYLAEYEFRHNFRELEDGDRTVKAIRMADGRRLKYEDAVCR